jgi:ribose 5-phosphate isomerase B
MKLVVSADEKLDVVQYILQYLAELGHEVNWLGPNEGETQPWPEVAARAARLVAQGKVEQGILLCWTGTGVSMAANKIRGIRAALCVDAETARGARLWNDANVLCLSMRLTSRPVAKEILDQWFATIYQPNAADDACLQSLQRLES